MRVACHTIDDFIRNLELGRVFGGVVHVDKTERPLDGDRRDAVKREVHFQASAVLEFEGGGECLLQAGEVCGVDFHDATQEFAGSERADELRAKIREYCERNGIVVMPGLVDV